MATKHSELKFSIRKLRSRCLKSNIEAKVPSTSNIVISLKPVNSPVKRKIMNDENRCAVKSFHPKSSAVNETLESPRKTFRVEIPGNTDNFINFKPINSPNPRKTLNDDNRKCTLQLFHAGSSNVHETLCSPRKSFQAEIPGTNNSKFSPSKIELSARNRAKSGTDKSPRKVQLFSPNVTCYQQARRVLSTSSSNELVGRDKELDFISSFINDHISKQNPGSLYISGAPGTGKTACVNHILKDIQQSKNTKVISINCMKLQNSSSIFKAIAEELKILPIPKPLRDVQKSILDKLLSSSSYIIIVLDEMDHLESKYQDVLYTIFEWPSLPKSCLLLIGIANALDLTDRILPRLQARQNCKPFLLHFQPYCREQITSILETRLKESLIDGQPVLKPSALQFCARKISSLSGDIRKALDVCRRAIELVETEVRKQSVLKATSDDRCNPGSPKKYSKPTFKSVEITQIISVLNKVYGQQTTGSESCSSLPLQQKFLICTLLLLTKERSKKEITVGKLHEVYCQVCRRRQVSEVDHVELLNLCHLIESRGIITIRKNKESRLAKVSLRLDQRELEHTLQDKMLIASILEDKDCLGKK